MCGASYLSCVGSVESGMNEGVAGVEVASMVGELREALVGLDLPYFFGLQSGLVFGSSIQLRNGSSQSIVILLRCIFRF